jgi:hypothetical protein
MNHLFLIIVFIVFLMHNFDYATSQCMGKDRHVPAPCESDSDCLIPGYVCSTYPKECPEYGTCIFACHADTDCVSGKSTCSKTGPHWFCTCKSSVDCFGGDCKGGLCTTY